jgi:hypothetical protein
MPQNKQIVEQEVNATIKLIMSTMEELAAMPPELASDPVAFNDRRIRLIRKVWNLAKECIRYGSNTVQSEQLR